MTSSFEETKRRLARATLLFHPLANAELQVNTDASSRAIAGAIHQAVRGHKQPLGFFSCRTTTEEAKYSAYDLELLAVYSTILKFRHVLEGRRFRVFTDQKPLTSAFFKAREPLSNRQRHQLAVISEFATDISHVPGLENVVADALSRQFDDEEAAAVVHSIVHTLSDVNLAELAEDQSPIEDVPPSSLRLQHVNFPGVKEKVVCDSSTGQPRILVLTVRQRRIFDAIHGLSHPSGKATLAVISRSYVWPNMRRDVILWARQCRECQTSKVAVHTKPPVKAIPVPENHFEHVHVDMVGPFPQDRGLKYLLTIIDRTTRWPEAIPMKDTSAETVLRAFLDGWVSRLGIPITVTTDRGAQFTSELWRRSLGQLGVNLTSTTAYHPQANGLVERFHPTLKNALKCVVQSRKSWTNALAWVMLGIRNAPRLDTSTSTAEVVFGTPLRVPG